MALAKIPVPEDCRLQQWMRLVVEGRLQYLLILWNSHVKENHFWCCVHLHEQAPQPYSWTGLSKIRYNFFLKQLYKRKFFSTGTSRNLENIRSQI